MSVPVPDAARFSAVDALIASQAVLPSPAERARLRKAHGLTQEQVAEAVNVRRATLVAWEKGKTDPRPPQREVYAHLLARLARLYPADGAPAAPNPETAGPEPSVQVPTPEPKPVSSRPATKKPATPSAATDPRFAHGPLAVLDGDGSAYCTGGLVLDCPAKTVPALVEWALNEAKLGVPRLHRSGMGSDPLIVLTSAAAERLGLPPELADRRGLRLPEDHRAVREIARAKWQLTRHGFGPWARVYRPVQAGRRQCVQLAVLPWGALDSRSWGSAATLPPAELACVLGDYASRVLTPCGSTAVSGLELSPPTRAVKDETCGWADPARHIKDADTAADGE